MKQKLVVWSFIAFSSSILTGCAGLMGESMFSGDKGRVLISADEAGMRAWSDMMTGAAVIAKTDPDELQDNPHTKMRGYQEDTIRAKWVALWSHVTGQKKSEVK